MHRKDAKEVTPLVEELNALLNQGKGRGLWGSKTDCARAIGVKKRVFSGMTIGERTDGEVRSATDKIRAVLDGRAQPQREELAPPSSAASNEATQPKTVFDRFFQLGVQSGTWKTMKGCGTTLAISYDSVRNFRDNDLAGFDSTRTKNLYVATMEKLRKLFPQQRERKGETAQKPPESTSVPAIPAVKDIGGQIDLASLISHPAIQRIDDLEAKLPAMIQTALAQLGGRPAAPAWVTSSSWVDEVIAGRQEIKNQKLPNVRFILTRETIRTLLTKYHGEEIAETQAFANVVSDAVVELRRRLTLIPQQQESADHASAARALVPYLNRVIRELVALAITVEEIRECDVEKGLIRAAQHFDSLSDVFNSSSEK